MKRIYLSSVKRSEIDRFTKVLAERLGKLLGGMQVNIVESDNNHGLAEFNDEQNPIDCGVVYTAIYKQLGLDLSEISVSVYNYKPNIAKGFGFMMKSTSEFDRNVDKIMALKDQLEQTIVGQSHAINVVTDGLIKAYSFVNSPRNGRPFASFILAGAPHTGKLSLAVQVAQGLGMPIYGFNKEDYLLGADNILGQLNSIMVTGKKCVVVFNDFECNPHTSNVLEGLSFFHQAGELGSFTFKNLILFFITSAGSEIYRRANFFDYAGVTTKDVISALSSETYPNGQPIFPEFLLEGLGVDAAVVFNNLTPYMKQLTIASHIQSYIEELNGNSSINVVCNPEMLANYAMFANPDDDIDAINKFVDDLINQQVAFLAKQYDDNGRLMSSIKNVVIEVNGKGASKQVMDLFAVNPRKGLVVAKEADVPLLKEANVDKVELVILSKVDEAIEALKKEEFDFILVDPTLEASANSVALLDVEDYDSEGMRFFNYATRYFNNIPLYILVNLKEMLPPSRYEHLLSMGARGYAGFSDEKLDTLESVIAYLSINEELKHDVEYLQDENIHLVANPKQTVVSKNDKEKFLLVSLQNMELAPLEMSIQEIEEDELRHIKTMDDIIGNDIAKEVLNKVSEYLTNTQEFIASGAIPNKLILLTGDSATGKTALVKVLAKQSRADLIKFDCKKAFMAFNRDPIKMIRTTFNHARQMAPAIVHIENIFFLFSPEVTGIIGSEVIVDTLNEELTICRRNTLRPVITIAEASLGEVRISHPKFRQLVTREIFTVYHTVEEVEEYLKRLLARKNITTVSKKTIKNLSKRLLPYGYRDINEFINFVLIENRGKEITDDTISDNLDLFTTGDSVRMKDDNEKLAVAYHEMGHYLLMRLSGKKSPFVTIIPRGDYGGYTANDGILWPRSKRDFLDRICMCFGGRAAEVILNGEEIGINTGISGDIANATFLARIMVTVVAMGDTLSVYNNDEMVLGSNPIVHQQIDKILSQEYERALRLLNLNRENLDILSKTLYEKGYVLGEDMEELIPDEKLIRE